MKKFGHLVRRCLLGVALCAVTASGFATSALATKSINMIAIDGYPARAMWVKRILWLLYSTCK